MDPTLYSAALAALLAQDRRAARLSPLHCRLMHAVCDPEGPYSIDKLAPRIERHPSYASRLALDLSAAGLVNRVESLSDRRRILVVPTRRGRTLDQRARSLADAAVPA